MKTGSGGQDPKYYVHGRRFNYHYKGRFVASRGTKYSLYPANMKVRVESSLDHGNADVVVVTLIELEVLLAISIGFPEVLNRVASS